MCPDRETLAAKEEVRVEFVRLDGYISVHDVLSLYNMVASKGY
jgi:hypothetical protein